MKKINWLDHTANLLVVILGISIAFYLESYKSETDNSRQEKNYLSSLVDDLDTDIQSIELLVKGNERIINSLLSLSNASVGMESLSDSGLVNSVFAIQYNPSFSPQRTTYESLKTSGKMDLIDDFELRNQIVSVYEQNYRSTQEFDIALSEHIRDFVKPFYMDNIKFEGRYKMNDEFLTKNEFRNIIFSYRYLFIAKNDQYKKVKDRVVEIKSNLINHLNQVD